LFKEATFGSEGKFTPAAREGWEGEKTKGLGRGKELGEKTREFAADCENFHGRERARKSRLNEILCVGRGRKEKC